MKSVCHVITRMVKGGASKIVSDIITNASDRFKFTLFTGPQDWDEKGVGRLKDFCNVRIIPSLVREINPFKDFNAYLQLRKEFLNNRFDVVHTHTSKAGVIGRIAARSAGIHRIIHTPHGSIYSNNSRIAGVPDIKIGKYPLLLAERFAGRRQDILTVLSNNERGVCIRLNLSAPENTVVIPNGIALDKFRSDDVSRTRNRKFLGLSDTDLMILCTGRLSHEKGHSVLISAFREAIKSNNSLRMGILGEGPLKNELFENNRDLIDAGRLSLYGYHEDVETYLSASDIFAMPSFYEGFGLALLEAMASGVPVIASDTGGISELVSDGVEGFLVKPGDSNGLAGKIIALGASMSLRKKLGEAGRLKAQNYSIDKMLDKYFNLYSA